MNYFDFKRLSQVHHISLMSFVFCGLIISHPVKAFPIRIYQQALALPRGKVTSLDLNFKARPSTHGPPKKETRVAFKHNLKPKAEAIPSQFQVITGLNLYYSMWVSVEIQGNPQPKVGVGVGGRTPFHVETRSDESRVKLIQCSIQESSPKLFVQIKKITLFFLLLAKIDLSCEWQPSLHRDAECGSARLARR